MLKITSSGLKKAAQQPGSSRPQTIPKAGYLIPTAGRRGQDRLQKRGAAGVARFGRGR